MKFFRYFFVAVVCLSTNIYVQEPANAQQSFSLSQEPTVWWTIPVLEFLQQSWENMAAVPRFGELAGAIHNGLENLEKWYRKTDDTNVYFICLGKHLTVTWHKKKSTIVFSP